MANLIPKGKKKTKQLHKVNETVKLKHLPDVFV